MRVQSYLIIAGIALTGAFGSGAALANMEDIVACTNITDDLARLACYDSAVPGVRVEIAEEDAAARAEIEEERDQRSFFGLPSFSIPNILARRETTPDEFGSAEIEAREMREQGRTAEQLEEEDRILTSVTADVVEWGRNPFGKYFVVLENGHVWRLINTNRLALRRTGTNTVRIRRGRLGNFFIKANDVSAEYRVERIR